MTPELVLDFWFGPLDAPGRASPEFVQRWWKKDAAFDDEIRARFLETHAALTRGGHADWLSSARGTLAAIIVLDQFSRNMFRGTPAMFASDPQALTLAKGLVARGDDEHLPAHPRTFVYLPLMHAEDLADQDACVAKFQKMVEREGDVFASNLDYAEKHRVIIRRFGRFPHRNAILGRASTEEELRFLEEPGSSF
ncbi:DUF924 domain-containing protein [Myxococcota bacterium]|nr:DUF924 domain-containing protein [Myxococcota bacterium]